MSTSLKVVSIAAVSGPRPGAWRSSRAAGHAFPLFGAIAVGTAAVSATGGTGFALSVCGADRRNTRAVGRLDRSASGFVRSASVFNVAVA